MNLYILLRVIDVILGTAIGVGILLAYGAFWLRRETKERHPRWSRTAGILIAVGLVGIGVVEVIAALLRSSGYHSS
jgi:nitrate reductase gamma subunit